MSSATDASGVHLGPLSPGWLAELLEVLEERRQVLLVAAAGLSVLGVLAALVAPGFVPPRPLVGAAVGLAAALLAVAITVAVDSADPTVTGPRHVRAAGGQVAAVLDATPSADAVAALAARIDARAGAGGRHWIALAPADRSIHTVSAWADVLGVALAARERRVVVIDLADGPRPGVPGVVEVVGDELKLGQAVDFDRELMLARLGPGADDVRALELLTGLVPRLPSDIEILVVALPPLARPGALAAAGTLDRILVFADAGATSRVDLIASLDAIDATDTASEVVLLAPASEDLPDLAPEPPSEPAPDPEPELRPEPDTTGPVLVEVPVVVAEPVARDDSDRAEATIALHVATALRTGVRDEDPDVTVPDADSGPAGDPLTEVGRWAAPPRHETLTGANLHPPRPLGDESDEDDEAVRMAAALQTLAQEVWSRDTQGA